MPIKNAIHANKSMTPRMIPSWQSRNFAWILSACVFLFVKNVPAVHQV